MTNNNNGYIPKDFSPNIPQAATVAVFDAETGENLTLNEWKSLNTTHFDQARIINHNKPYQSEKALLSKPSYGPCSYPDVPFNINIYNERQRKIWFWIALFYVFLYFLLLSFDWSKKSS